VFRLLQGFGDPVGVVVARAIVRDLPSSIDRAWPT
jgi:hypothetical protein